MKLKKITQVDILYLSISMFIIVVIWIALSLYHSYVTSTISDDLQLQITPIDANFDTATIDRLKSRTKIEPLSELSAQPATPSGTITPTPEATVDLTPTETASQTGTTDTTTPSVAPSLTQTPSVSP